MQREKDHESSPNVKRKIAEINAQIENRNLAIRQLVNELQDLQKRKEELEDKLGLWVCVSIECNAVLFHLIITLF